MSIPLDDLDPVDAATAPRHASHHARRGSQWIKPAVYGAVVVVAAGAGAWFGAERAGWFDSSPTQALTQTWDAIVTSSAEACTIQSAGAMPDREGNSPLNAPVKAYRDAATSFNSQRYTLDLSGIPLPAGLPINVSVEQDGAATDWCVVAEAIAAQAPPGP